MKEEYFLEFSGAHPSNKETVSKAVKKDKTSCCDHRWSPPFSGFPHPLKHAVPGSEVEVSSVETSFLKYFISRFPHICELEVPLVLILKFLMRMSDPG